MDSVDGVREADEAEVVLAFLTSELTSPRFGHLVREALIAAGGISLVTSPNLTNANENSARAQALEQARGWRTNTGLFDGFPSDVSWCHAQLMPAELGEV